MRVCGCVAAERALLSISSGSSIKAGGEREIAFPASEGPAAAGTESERQAMEEASEAAHASRGRHAAGMHPEHALQRRQRLVRSI